MIYSKSISSSRIQIQFKPPSNSYTNSFTSSSFHITSLNFHNTRLKSPLCSIKTVPKATSRTISSLYTTSHEETLYDLLGISETGTSSEIKKAYKQMALKYHPDVSPPERLDEYTMRFIMVQEAYQTLSDPEARARYDSSMAKGLHLAFYANSGSRFEARSYEKARWKSIWETQVAELKRRSTVADQGGRGSWAARIREHRSGSWAHGSGLDQ
ncbi:chaperone protein dnaJ 20, chloroplastic-like [Rutidosis leptorrhynchoides]|uniref:chaperone protein dnaJ 20, chloroplastic-like n=1 Tax=Rutidosis leptorrhynchoides TaxID=125765 RepID=UPI003A998446